MGSVFAFTEEKQGVFSEDIGYRGHAKEDKIPRKFTDRRYNGPPGLNNRDLLLDAFVIDAVGKEIVSEALYVEDFFHCSLRGIKVVVQGFSSRF